MADATKLVLVDRIEPLIQTIRGQNVILDADLAVLYGVPTKRLNEQVRRNQRRFPGDFVFQLTAAEAAALRSQNATAPGDEPPMRSQNATASKRNVRFRPLAFTEHGAIMAASVLNSSTAIEVSVFVVRAFVKLRELVLAHKDLARKLSALEQRYDAQFKVVLTQSGNSWPRRRRRRVAGKSASRVKARSECDCDTFQREEATMSINTGGYWGSSKQVVRESFSKRLVVRAKNDTAHPCGAAKPNARVSNPASQ